MRMLLLKRFDPIVLNLRSARIFFTGHKIPLHYLSDTSATYVYMTVSAARTKTQHLVDVANKYFLSLLGLL
jgi:hypothetical protein